MNLIQRTNNLTLFFLLFILLFSCSNSKTYKIGMLLPNIVDDRFPKDRDNFTAEVKKLGGEVITKECKNDDKIQIQQAQELIDQGVKVLAIIAVNKNTAATIVREAHKKGVVVIAYDRIIANCDLDYFVSFDNVKVGEMMAEGALKQKEGGNFILLGGDKSDQNAIWVKEGMIKVLDPKVKEGKVKIVYDVFIEDWSGDNAYHEIKTYLNLSSSVPDAIVSAYDGLTTGAIKALDENKVPLAKFPAMSGQNAELEACQNIVRGKQTMTVYKPLKKLAEQVAILASNIAKGEELDKRIVLRPMFNGAIKVPSILIEPTYVDSSKMMETIINDGFWKKTDVYSEN
jgi:D-xylose transport system substrate-binding protein